MAKAPPRDPSVQIRLFRSLDGTVPVLEALDDLTQKAREKCLYAIALLREQGHTARRPLAENLGDGLYELRIKVGRVNHRILYFFHGQEIIVLAHYLTKEREVPTVDLKRVGERRELYLSDPDRYSAGDQHDD